MLLNVALLNMINRCECLFFLNTPNSFNAKQEIKNTTFSPWIYSELSMANSIRQSLPLRYKNVKKPLIEQSVVQFSQEDFHPELKVALKPKINNLVSFGYPQLQYWLDNCEASKKLKNLDDLYEQLALGKA